MRLIISFHLFQLLLLLGLFCCFLATQHSTTAQSELGVTIFAYMNHCHDHILHYGVVVLLRQYESIAKFFVNKQTELNLFTKILIGVSLLKFALLAQICACSA